MEAQEKETSVQTDMNPAEKIAELRKIYRKYTSRKFFSMLNACVNCGVCANACHYYCSEENPDFIPVNRIKKLASVISEYFHPVKSRLPFFSPESPLTNKKFDVLFTTAFENCTMCGNCAMVCPMGINTGEIMYVGRALLYGLGKVPAGLIEPVRITLETGNYLGISDEDFIETVEWLAEEMEDDMGEGFTIPVNKENANVLYIPHPLTLRDLPYLLMAEIKILAAAGEDYTLSTHDFNVVNYAYYQGSKENAFKVAKSTLDAREKINAKSIAMAPCGHGYRILRWETEKIMGKRHDYPIETLVVLIDRYIKEGRLKLAKDKFEGPITYHDPCNVARRGGVIQEPRNVIKALTSNFVEMEPHGVHNFCCGGGGGLASTASFGKIRAAMGKAKADQIKRTGAKIVVTGCFNCRTQIRDVVQNYGIDAEVKSIVEVVADSIIM